MKLIVGDQVKSILNVGLSTGLLLDQELAHFRFQGLLKSNLGSSIAVGFNRRIKIIIFLKNVGLKPWIIAFLFRWLKPTVIDHVIRFEHNFSEYSRIF